MAEVYISIGSNLGDKLHHLLRAQSEIVKRAGRLLGISSIYETEPWGFDAETSFLNQALKIETLFSPDELMGIFLAIETEMGRVRGTGGYHSRVIDIDILFYDELLIHTAKIEIPHPRLQLRRFVLEPLAEIGREMIHPVFRKTISELLTDCPDRGKVKKYTGST